MKNDSLFIEEMEVACKVGTTSEERAFPQILRVTIVLELPLLQAGQSDSIAHTVDYAALIADVRRACLDIEFILVERVAEIIAATALHYRPVRAVRVKVSKKVFAGIAGVGTEIYRERSSESSMQ